MKNEIETGVADDIEVLSSVETWTIILLSAGL